MRAIIDVGCQFRGIRNENVAKMILQHLVKDPPIKGVLYFNQEDGKLYCMPCDPAKQDRPICLSGTRKETILAETGLEPDELFTYYDQEHITGVDITQAPKAVAVITISEHSKIHEVLQGARRMRALDLGQRLLFAVQNGALGKISMKLEKELKDKCPVHDLLLYTHLREVESEPDENFRFCVQKLEAKVQKEVLKKLFQQEDQVHERELFARVAYLYVKDITLDLYREYAYPHEMIEKAKFLENLKENLIGPLQNVEHLFTTEEWSTLSSALGTIIDEALPGIQELLAYNAPEGRNSTNTQYQQVQTEQTSMNINQNINQNLNLQKIASLKLDKEKSWPVEILESGDFMATLEKEGEPQEGVPQEGPKVLQFNTKINNKLFSKDLYITSNFATTLTDRADGPKEMKVPYEVLGIEDSTGKRQLLLCTVKEAQEFESLMLAGSMKPQDKKIWLMRTNGTLIASSEHRVITTEVKESFKKEVVMGEQGDLRQLLIEAIFFSGKLHLLNEEAYLELFRSWIKDQTESCLKFFEAYLKDKAPADYANTPAYRSLITTR